MIVPPPAGGGTGILLRGNVDRAAGIAVGCLGRGFHHHIVGCDNVGGKGKGLAGGSVIAQQNVAVGADGVGEDVILQRDIQGADIAVVHKAGGGIVVIIGVDFAAVYKLAFFDRYGQRTGLLMRNVYGRAVIDKHTVLYRDAAVGGSVND